MNNLSDKRGRLISLLSVYFAANVIFITSPALNSWATQLYPDIPYGTVLFLSTVSSLLMIPGSLVAGALLGNKIGYRKMAIISLGGIIIAGSLPFFIRDFTFVLITRAIVGFCIGLGFPLQSTLALKLFNNDERPKVLGLATFVMACGSIFYMSVSGLVSDIDSAYAFLVHGVLIIPLVLVLIFLKEPKGVDDSQITKNDILAREKIPLKALTVSFLFMLIFLSFYPMLLNMSAVVEYENIGSATITGLISALFTIGNAIAGLIFAKLYAISGKYIIPIGLLLWILGISVFSFGNGVIPLVLGITISGIATQIVWPGTVNSFSKYVPESKLSMVNAIFVSGMNIGCFLATFFISGVTELTGSSNPRVPSQIGLLLVIVVALIWSGMEIGKKNKLTNKELENDN